MTAARWPTVPDDVTEAKGLRSTLEPLYLQLRSDLVGVIDTLRSLDYQFITAPGPRTDAERYRMALRPLYIERCGEPPPLTVDMFWEHVGSVNLSGNLPEPGSAMYTTGSRSATVYADPLWIDDVVESTNEIEHVRHGSRPDSSPRVELAPDIIRKANHSGGDPLLFHLPAPPDPPILDVNAWPDGTTFTWMLQVSMAWGGFPGFRRAERGVAEPAWLSDLRSPLTERYAAD